MKVLFSIGLVISILYTLNQPYITKECFTCTGSHMKSLHCKHLKYCSQSILYYCNSTATFRCLLNSGDIQPNPGPVNRTENVSNIGHTNSPPYSADCTALHISYNLNDLHQINNQPLNLLPMNVWSRICDLGIGRRRRTHRGRGRRTMPRPDFPPPMSVSSNSLKLGLWNARSMTNKTHAITDLIVEHDLDVLVITESWLSGDSKRDGLILADLRSSLPNYDFTHRPRLSSKGGGILLLYRSTARCTLNNNNDFASFELLDVTLNLTPSSAVRLYCIYRPPPSANNNLSNGTFLDEFPTLLEGAVVDDHFPLLLGDFNIHVDDPNDNFAKSVMTCVDSLGFKQHVREPTHRAGHTLDLIFTRNSDDVCNVNSLSSMPSDHCALVTTVNIARPKNPKKEVSFRKYRSIDKDSLRNSIDTMFHSLPDLSCPSASAEHYNSSLRTLIDEHAPIQVKTVSIRPDAPWFTDDIQEAKRRRRRAERRSIKSGLFVDRELYRRECESYYECIFNAKSAYLKDLIKNADTKELFRLVKTLSTPTQSSPLPDHSSDSELANRFATFFREKVAKVVSSFPNVVPAPASRSFAPGPRHELSDFCLVSLSQVRKLITSLPSKHCKLDPIPTWLLKEVLDELLPHITKLFNLSLSSGIVPESFKTSLLLPLLKKPSLDTNGLKNYRPIANLPFLGKVLERIVSLQLKAHIDNLGLFPIHQSAYRNHHSTETATVKVLNDLLLAVDKGNEAVLILLDYTAAFDTINHDLLLHRLENDFSITGTVLQWIRSYLMHRTQKVIINDTNSESFPLICGVPQGSVVGPLLFILYTSPLSNVINLHQNIQHTMYADDTQIYVTLHPNSRTVAANKLTSCLNEIKTWSFQNCLCLNDSKSEMIHITSKFRNSDPFPDLVMSDGSLSCCASVRDLGLNIDSNLTFKQHISNICKSASFGIYKISRIRRLLDRPTTSKLVHAFVSTHIDYCNSSLSGLPQSHLVPLQRVQNSAARLVTLSRKSEHITPILNSLHWLKIHHRISFKILLLCYKAINGLAPSYLSDLISLRSRTSSRTLRSSSTLLLTPGPRTNTRYGDRAFSVIAPALWNKLPAFIHCAPSVSQFKSLLKTYLFKL